MENVHTVCDYIIRHHDEFSNEPNLSFLKLQKLLYYCQAWSLALGRGRLMDERFQAWVHGPVSRAVYDRFSGTKDLYSPITRDDLDGRAITAMSPCSVQTVNEVLESYGKLSGSELEYLSHQELPWQSAREGLSEFERGDKLIDEDLMKSFYAELNERS